MTNVPAEEEKAKSRLRRYMPQPEALRLIPEALARKCVAIPIDFSGGVIHVAMADPTDIFALEALAAHCQTRIVPEYASAKDIQEAIDFNYKSYEEIEKHISNISIPEDSAGDQIKLDTVTDAPVAQALSLIISEAVKAGASDIHLHPEEDKLRVRFRVDGTLRDILSLPQATAFPLVSRIKILASMNIADHHRPQDGQFSITTKAGRSIDIRVATITTVNGEMVVMRLLDKSRASMPLSNLGFLPECLEKYEGMLKAPYGMILASGPTGAGKTTTLYASVNTLDRSTQNIITVEDPVEYHFSGVNQAQVNAKAGLTFASGLRSILRLDPDVILVGEIRDAETAGIAVQSALTGHLVLSSIHANDAVSVVLRLLDLNIEQFLVASALIGVIAQRMVRKVCPECARLIEAPLPEQIAYTRETGEKRTQFMYGAGCKSCAGSGYQGRMGIFELLTMNDELRTLLLNNATATQLRTQAIKDGMTPLIKDGMLKVKMGMTTPTEVLKNAYTLE